MKIKINSPKTKIIENKSKSKDNIFGDEEFVLVDDDSEPSEIVFGGFPPDNEKLSLKLPMMEDTKSFIKSISEQKDLDEKPLFDVLEEINEKEDEIFEEYKKQKKQKDEAKLEIKENDKIKKIVLDIIQEQGLSKRILCSTSEV